MQVTIILTVNTYVRIR